MNHRPTARAAGRPALRRTTIVGALVAALVGASGVAYAAWSSSGSGSVTAKSGTALAPTTSVNGLVVTSGLLYPGGAAGDAKVTITNPNPYPVKVTSVVGTGAGTSAGCTTSGVTFTTQNPTTGNGIAANNGTLDMTFAGAVPMTTASTDDCQNKVFAIPVTVTIASG